MIRLPLITIITVTYNAELFLEKTIQSIINQNYKNIEYIIIDGKSSDETLTILEKYKNNISFWISEPDNGIYDAMNKGISKATGEWINFMNAGDTFSNNDILQTIANNIDKNIEIIYGDRYIVDNTRDLKQYSSASKFENIHKSMPSCHQSIFIKNDLLKDNLFNTAYPLAADYDLLLRLNKRNVISKHIEYPICNYLLGGISIQQKISYNIEALYILSKYIDSFEKLMSSSFYIFLETIKQDKSEAVYFEKYSENNRNFLNKLIQAKNTFNHIFFNNRSIAIYGFGTFGQYLYNLTPKKENIIVIDNNPTEPFIKEPKILTSINVDAIIICALGYEREIEHFLVYELNIDSKKIIKFDFSKENQNGYFI